MSFRTLSDWLGWLEHCHPREIDLGLDRIREVAERLDLLAPSAKVITVAGTNGKGSCVTSVAALLRTTGCSVGVYTSPHLLHYCERICVNGEPASEDEVCAAFESIHAACGTITLTYFEFGTLAALQVFRQRQVDFMVLEVGLGGRLDAVNIIDADIAVITSIDLDHQDWLGDNRETIAYEKAGIIRAHRPVVCCDPQPPRRLVDEIVRQQADVYWINQQFGFTENKNDWSWWGQSADKSTLNFSEMPLPALPLPSLSAAIQVAQLLDLNISHNSVSTVLAQLQIPGRFQQLTYNQKAFILDVAHNPAATAYLAERLRALATRLAELGRESGGKILAIVAMMADKDRYSSLRNLTPLINSWYLADLSYLPRAATPEQMEETLDQLDVTPAGRGTVAECVQQAIAQAEPEDHIVVFGSFFTVAAVLSVMQPQR